MPKTLPPSNSDALTFSKKDQLSRRGSPDSADLPFSKQRQMRPPPDSTRPTPRTVARPRPPGSDAGPPFGKSKQADLPFGKVKQLAKAPGATRSPR